MKKCIKTRVQIPNTKNLGKEGPYCDNKNYVTMKGKTDPNRKSFEWEECMDNKQLTNNLHVF